MQVQLHTVDLDLAARQSLKGQLCSFNYGGKFRMGVIDTAGNSMKNHGFITLKHADGSFKNFSTFNIQDFQIRG